MAQILCFFAEGEYEMAISLWMVLAVAVIATTMVSNLVRARLDRRDRNDKLPSDQVRPRPSHYPLVSSNVYS